LASASPTAVIVISWKSTFPDFRFVVLTLLPSALLIYVHHMVAAGRPPWRASGRQ
jgi:hypothetical protein